MDWMEIFQKDFADTPILVCLTHADRLYENSCEKDMIPECPKSKIPGLNIQFEDELKVMKWHVAATLLYCVTENCWRNYITSKM